MKVKEGEECPPSRCEMLYTCRLYNMHDWLQPWSVITYEVGWHPNLTIGGHTVLTFGCLLDVSCKNARKFYKNSSPGHTNTVYKMGPQLVFSTLLGSKKSPGGAARSSKKSTKVKVRWAGTSRIYAYCFVVPNFARWILKRHIKGKLFFSHILEHFESLPKTA